MGVKAGKSRWVPAFAGMTAPISAAASPISTGSGCPRGVQHIKCPAPLYPPELGPTRPTGEPMARITVEDCLDVVDNRFELVLMASKRARQLVKGVEATIDNTEHQDKPTVLALREIAARKIDRELIDAVEKAERERAEREALEWAAAEVVDDDLSKGLDD